MFVLSLILTLVLPDVKSSTDTHASIDAARKLKIRKKEETKHDSTENKANSIQHKQNDSNKHEHVLFFTKT